MDAFLWSYLIWLIPAAGVLGLASGTLAAVCGRRPGAERHRLYGMFAYEGLFAAVCLYIPTAALYFHSPYPPIPLDDWPANWGLIALPLAWVPIFALLDWWVGQTLLGSAPDESDLFDLPARVRATWERIGLCCTALGAVAVCLRDSGALSWDGRSLGGGLFGVAMAPFAVQWMYLSTAREGASVDDGLTARVAALTKAMGLRSCRVEVAGKARGAGHAYALAYHLRPIIYVSRRAAEVLASEEMEFVLAHELAHARHPALASARRAATAAWAIGYLQMLLCFALMEAYVGSGGAAAIIMGGFPGLGAFLMLREYRPIHRRIEHEADRLALLATGNLESACSALNKMAAHSGSPARHQQDFGEEHPRLSRRLQALAYAAEEAGLLQPAGAAGPAGEPAQR